MRRYSELAPHVTQTITVTDETPYRLVLEYTRSEEVDEMIDETLAT